MGKTKYPCVRKRKRRNTLCLEKAREAKLRMKKRANLESFLASTSSNLVKPMNMNSEHQHMYQDHISSSSESLQLASYCREDMAHGENTNNYDPVTLSQPTTSNGPETYIFIAANSETCTDWQAETNEIKEDPDATDKVQPNLLLEVPVAEPPFLKPGPAKRQSTSQPRPKKKPKVKEVSLTIRTSKRLAQPTSNPKQSKRLTEPTSNAKQSKRLPESTSNPKQSEDAKEDFTNEFDVFGRFVALQLKNLSEEDAVLAQSEIQEVLIRYRLNKIKTRYEVPIGSTQSVSQSQSDLATGEEVLKVKCEPDSE